MIRLSKSHISKEEKSAVLKVLDEEYLGMGTYVEAFEKDLAGFLEMDPQNVVCVNTGTSALHLALQSLGIGPGDEVLVPTITYVASYQAISATGAKPVSCDVIENTVCIDVEDAKKRITERTKAIMPVHYAGENRFMDEVYDLANTYSLRIIEDAAHSFGGTRDGKRIGNRGDIICFSFDGIKNITCGEGGAIISKDNTLTERCRDGRLLGVVKDTENRFNSRRSWNFEVLHQGFRYHMSNINAAIGIEQLKKIDSFVERRRELVAIYRSELDVLDGLKLLEHDFDNNAPHIFVIRVLGGEKQNVVDFLSQNGVQTGFHYAPNHKLALYEENEMLPVANQLECELVTLPLHYDLSDTDVLRVTGLIKKFFSGERDA